MVQRMAEREGRARERRFASQTAYPSGKATNPPDTPSVGKRTLVGGDAARPQASQPPIDSGVGGPAASAGAAALDTPRAWPRSTTTPRSIPGPSSPATATPRASLAAFTPPRGALPPSVAPVRHPDAAGVIDAAASAESGKLGQAFATKRAALQSSAASETAAILSSSAVAHASTVSALTERE